MGMLEDKLESCMNASLFFRKEISFFLSLSPPFPYPPPRGSLNRYQRSFQLATDSTWYGSIPCYFGVYPSEEREREQGRGRRRGRRGYREGEREGGKDAKEGEREHLCLQPFKVSSTHPDMVERERERGGC